MRALNSYGRYPKNDLVIVIMKFFKNDGKEHIRTDSPVEVSLEFVLEEVDRFPTEDEFEGNFMGITNNKNETIQFVRFNKNSWFLDFPIVIECDYSHSLQSDGLTTKEVKNIIRKFLRGEDCRTLVNLTSSKQEPLVDKTKRRIESFKEVGDEGAVMTSEEVLTKEEFIQKLEDFPCSSNDTTYGILVELSTIHYD